MSPRALLFAITLLPCAMFAQAEAKGSNLLGQLCPELKLETEMVQGDPITQADFAGKMVFFCFYQRGCPGCEEQAMPALQKLHERYGYSKCALVLAINTAFDKDKDAYVADVAATRAHLRAKGWTMPVARDLNEESNPLFTLDGIAGTPQAVVLDENGFVCDHDWFSTRDEIRDLNATADAVFAGLNCECVRLPRRMTGACKGAFEHIRKGEYNDAWHKATEIADKPESRQQDKSDAEVLKEWLTGLVKDRTRKFEESFDYDPIDTVDRADVMADKFKAVPGAQDLITKADTWRRSDTYAKFKQAKDELETAEADLARPNADTAAGRKKLEDIASRAGNTKVGDRARAGIKAINGGQGLEGGTSRDAGQPLPARPGNAGAVRAPNGAAARPAVSPTRGARPHAAAGNAAAPRTHSESRVQGSAR
ncbi:MAG: redoxin domain-containing protein [Planctomycetes bacterium]|nr:redoxin domain-containing protein [Planctomycetota bacterium]